MKGPPPLGGILSFKDCVIDLLLAKHSLKKEHLFVYNALSTPLFSFPQLLSAQERAFPAVADTSLRSSGSFGVSEL